MRGYTLLEMLVALAVSALVSLGLVTLFQLHARAARRQTRAAELQQSTRIARREIMRPLRMCGRGGLPSGPLPDGLALAIRNNVGAGEHIGDPDTPLVAAGSDVLVVRGVFEWGPVAVRPRLVEDGDGEIVADRLAPGGAVQDLSSLADALADASGEALLISSSLAGEAYGVFELVGGDTRTAAGSGEVLELTLEFRADGSELAEAYRGLHPAGRRPEGFLAAWAGILEEHRYYVRRDENPFTGEPVGRLSRARFYPGSERPHPTVPAAAEDIADHAVDLQIALGADLDGDGALTEGAGEARAADEWLLNDPADDPARWRPAGAWAVRLTTLFRSARPERGFLAPPIDSLEDHAYDERELPRTLEDWERRRYERLGASGIVRPRGLR